ncbi:hypothetical protein NQ318_020742 [Aromia moschata]|uniref:DUF5641 domain-containing protein n=1 Tax=Aromia moschata TaxID=1265417 RepID=A0AAV8YZI9_9CUCU|nr:hypothetical protein NQ318_020742 [Aromia moschata]
MAFGKAEKSPARLCKKVSVTLKSEYSDELITINAVEVPEICFDSLCTPSLEDPAIYNFSINFSLADSPNFNTKTVPGISILIGADYYWKIVTNNTQKITESLMGIETKFGWTIHGVGGGHSNEYAFAVSVNVANILHVQCEVKDNDIDLKNFWTLESIGIDNVKVTDSLQTDNFMTNNVTFDNNRYCVSLPWKDQCGGVDSNFNGALNRLKSLTRRLANTGKFEEYDNAIREYIDNDCVEPPRVPDSNKTYFMPHRAVYRDDKDTSKIRVVFDASAHAPGLPSLNDVLQEPVKSKNFKVGEVCPLHDQNTPRLLWKLVKITQVFPGRDGRVRACEIITGNKTVLRRPVQLLFPLEIIAAGEDVEN